MCTIKTMISSITAKNYQSLANETTLDLTVTKKAAEKNGGYASSNDGTRVSLIEAVIGGNASGKTTILKALALIKWLHTDSFRWNPDRDMPIKGFAGSTETKDAPTDIIVVFELNSLQHTYRVQLTRERILSEELTVRSITSKRQTTKKILTRTWLEKEKIYSVSDTDFKLKEPYWVSDELRTTSVIAAAAKFGNERASELIRYWKKIKTNIDITDRYMPYQYQAYHALEAYQDNDKLRAQAELEVRKYDLGIDSFGKDGTILHKHGDSTFELDLNEESSGTQQFLALKERVDYVLQNGGLALIDELNAYLHPVMVEAVIEKFKDPDINVGRGQFLFSTHDLGIFKTLDPYQISIAEKDNHGITSIKRFDTQDIRPSDDYIKRYLAGQYGGLQRIKLK
jgi:AAA15 family ATPase/GTPase